MAGLFNMFGGISLGAKQRTLSGPNDSSVQLASEPTIFGGAGAMAAKSAVATPAKPRGLSMRSTSDLNVPRGNIVGERSPKKKSPSKSIIKAYFEVPESIARPSTPRLKDKSSKILTLKSKQLKAQSSRAKSPGTEIPIEKKQADEALFKKPEARIRSTNRFTANNGEPERLAYYCAEKPKRYTIEPLDRELAEFIRCSRAAIKPYEDDGFMSEPELLPIPKLTITDDFVALDPVIPETFELPEISEDDDFLN